MPVKIKKRLQALTFTEKAKPIFFKMVNRIIADKIREFLDKGISPVNMRTAKIPNTGGKNRFTEYSDSYKKSMGRGKLANKKQTPRNLKVSGKLHNSIKSRKKQNSVSVWFSDSKAKYHNDLGAGKSKTIRRLLPRDGERWAIQIEKVITEVLAEAIKLSTK